jgi:hypothetical protein
VGSKNFAGDLLRRVGEAEFHDHSRARDGRFVSRCVLTDLLRSRLGIGLRMAAARFAPAAAWL